MARGSNLGLYDKNLLENIDVHKYFFSTKEYEYKNISNTQIINHYTYYKSKGLLKIISYIQSQIKLFIWIFKNSPDIIHFQWIRLPLWDSFLLLFIKFLKSNSRIIYTAHNILPHDSGKKYFYQYYFMYHLFDGIIVHVECTKNDIIRLFNIKETKIEIIPHGKIEFKKKAIQSFSCQDKLVFSLVGVMSYYKGVDILIDAWVLNDQILNNANIHLIIAGSGNISGRNIPIQSNITIINRLLTNEEYQSIIENTDIGILPYRAISQSGVLLSLLAMHKPVIVSNCGGLTQPFEIGKVGWIIDELSHKALSEVIYSIVHDKYEFLKIRDDKELWTKIDDFYSWHRIGAMTLKYYNTIISIH
jgi:glycosyltransferase involved in cell wall biosynthesis